MQTIESTSISSGTRTTSVISGSPRPRLTPREVDVLRCLVAGKAYKQAAAHLGISVETVRTHIKALYRKLDVHCQTEAVVRALREDLI